MKKLDNQERQMLFGLVLLAIVLATGVTIAKVNNWGVERISLTARKAAQPQITEIEWAHCQYLYATSKTDGRSNMVHKANCSNPAHRKGGSS